MLKAILTLPILSLLISFHTIKETEPVTPESSGFNIEDFSWLVGTWTGDGFGGQSEETWSTPVDDTMMGMFRHYKDGEIVFYEFLLLDETGLKLKHFNPDITSWEEKDDFVSFEMISYTKDKIELKGLVFERKSDTEMEIHLRMRKSDGETFTEVFSMKREG